MTEVIFGKSKALDDITLEELHRHPIWVSALDEEGIEGQDESWQKPVINTTDVTDSVAGQLTGAMIAFKVVGKKLLYGCGEYDHGRGTIGLPWFLHHQRRVDLCEVPGLTFPVIFEALPKIRGESGVRFSCPTPEAWEARRID